MSLVTDNICFAWTGDFDSLKLLVTKDLALVMSIGNVRSCDDFFKKILLNPNDKLHGLLPYNISVISSLRNKRNFTIPICKTDRFKNSFIIAAARRYNDYTSF